MPRVNVRGKVIEFPDSMSKEDIADALRKKFPKEAKEQIIREVIREVPKIVEKEIIKEVVKTVPKIREIKTETSLAPLMNETLQAIRMLLSKPPVQVREITTNPEFVIQQESEPRIKRWTFEVMERDRSNNILTVEAIPEYE